MKTKRINKEVIAIDEPFASLTRADLRTLVKMAEENDRKRMRICVHQSEEEKHQEMFIVHTKDVYVRPHKHLNRAESFLVLEGEADVVLFDDQGNITDVIRVADYASGGNFYYRVSTPVFHCLLIRSDYLLFKESTTGPFQRSESMYAPWAPDDTNPTAIAEFQDRLRKKMTAFSN